MFPDSARDARTLLKQADAAMYRSKQTGPGGSVIYATEYSDAMNKLSMAIRLRRAVVYHRRRRVRRPRREPPPRRASHRPARRPSSTAAAANLAIAGRMRARGQTARKAVQAGSTRAVVDSIRRA